MTGARGVIDNGGRHIVMTGSGCRPARLDDTALVSSVPIIPAPWRAAVEGVIGPSVRRRVTQPATGVFVGFCRMPTRLRFTTWGTPLVAPAGVHSLGDRCDWTERGDRVGDTRAVVDVVPADAV